MKPGIKTDNGLLEREVRKLPPDMLAARKQSRSGQRAPKRGWDEQALTRQMIDMAFRKWEQRQGVSAVHPYRVRRG